MRDGLVAAGHVDAQTSLVKTHPSRGGWLSVCVVRGGCGDAARGAPLRVLGIFSGISAMPLTRRQQKKVDQASLPLDPSVLVHVLAELDLEADVHSASAVCRCWKERVDASSRIDDDPDCVVGELRSGDKPYRFDRPHDAIFLPNGDVMVADCDNFRLQVYSREGCYLREIKLSGHRLTT